MSIYFSMIIILSPLDFAFCFHAELYKYYTERILCVRIAQGDQVSILIRCLQSVNHIFSSIFHFYLVQNYFKSQFKMKFCILIVFQLLLLPLRISSTISTNFLNTEDECKTILRDAGFSKLGGSTMNNLRAIFYQVIESSPELNEKLSHTRVDIKMTPEERNELITLFDEAYEANKSVYQVQIRKVLKDVPRSLIFTIKTKFVAVWNRVKDFFKRAWRKVTGKSDQSSIREKRFATLAFIGISMVFVSLYMVFIVMKATGHRILSLNNYGHV